MFISSIPVHCLVYYWAYEMILRSLTLNGSLKFYYSSKLAKISFACSYLKLLIAIPTVVASCAEVLVKT